jgi:hypothetical protein
LEIRRKPSADQPGDFLIDFPGVESANVVGLENVWVYLHSFSSISVGRGFTPRQAGRKGPPYGYEPGASHKSGPCVIRQGGVVSEHRGSVDANAPAQIAIAAEYRV